MQITHPPAAVRHARYFQAVQHQIVTPGKGHGQPELLQRLGNGFSGFAEGGQGSFLVQVMDEGIVERPGVVIDRASARHPAHHADPALAHEIGVHFLTGILEPPHHDGRAVLPQDGVTGMTGLDPAQEIFLKREVECRVEGMIHDPIHAELHKKTFIMAQSHYESPKGPRKRQREEKESPTANRRASPVILTTAAKRSLRIPSPLLGCFSFTYRPSERACGLLRLHRRDPL